jgi:hypothetical protein
VDELAQRPLDAGTGLHSYVATSRRKDRRRVTVYISPEINGPHRVGSVPCPAAPRRSPQALIEQLLSRSVIHHPLVRRLTDGRLDNDAPQQRTVRPRLRVVPTEPPDAADEVLTALRMLNLDGNDPGCLPAQRTLREQLIGLFASADRCERLGALMAAHVAVRQLLGPDATLREDLLALAAALPEQAGAADGMRSGALAVHRLIWRMLDELQALPSDRDGSHAACGDQQPRQAA